jgi:hypothetical protein
MMLRHDSLTRLGLASPPNLSLETGLDSIDGATGSA